MQQQKVVQNTKTHMETISRASDKRDLRLLSAMHSVSNSKQTCPVLLYVKREYYVWYEIITEPTMTPLLNELAYPLPYPLPYEPELELLREPYPPDLLRFL